MSLEPEDTYITYHAPHTRIHPSILVGKLKQAPSTLLIQRTLFVYIYLLDACLPAHCGYSLVPSIALHLQQGASIHPRTHSSSIHQ